MKPSRTSILSLLAAVMIFPAGGVKAEGPIEHLEKRRRQIHEIVGQFLFGVGRKIEESSESAASRRPPPPPPYGGPRHEEPYYEEDFEPEYRYRRPQEDWEPDRPEYERRREMPRDLRREDMPTDQRREYRAIPRDPGLAVPKESRREPSPYRAPEPAPLPEPAPTPPPQRRQLPAPAPLPTDKGGAPGAKTQSSTGSASGSTLRYGRPVPGKRGFVYPPGVKEESQNMVDVRDFQPGQKVKDPRTGEVFLVP